MSRSSAESLRRELAKACESARRAGMPYIDIIQEVRHCEAAVRVAWQSTRQRENRHEKGVRAAIAPMSTLVHSAMPGR